MFKIEKSYDRYTLYITLQNAKEMYLFSRAITINDEYGEFTFNEDIHCSKPYYHTDHHSNVTVRITFFKEAYIESCFNFTTKDVTKVKKFIQKQMKKKYS